MSWSPPWSVCPWTRSIVDKGGRGGRQAADRAVLPAERAVSGVEPPMTFSFGGLRRTPALSRFIVRVEGPGSGAAGRAALLTPLSPKWQRGCLRHHVGVAEPMCGLPYFLGHNVSPQARGALRGDSCGTPPRRDVASGGSPEARDPLRPSFPLQALEGNCLSWVPSGGDAWSLVVSSD